MLDLSCELYVLAAYRDHQLTDSNEILESEGVVPDYEDGIRITDAKTLQVARVSYTLRLADSWKN